MTRRGALLLPILTALLALPAAAEAQVRFERTGFRLTSIGEQVAVSGRVLDARRRPVPSTRLRWRISDPSIASVSPQGVVVSRKSGNTRLWAVSGTDSASALIVVDQWAAKFEFAPGLMRLDAVGAKAPLKINVRDAEGHLIAEQNRKAATCRSLNERVAALAPNGEVTARANGVTYVRCTDRGVADSVRIEVRQRAARVTIADKATFTNPKYVGEVFTLRASAHDRSNDEIREPVTSWASLNPTILSVDPLSGATRAIGAGTARVIAQVGDVSDTLSIPVSPSLGQPVPPNSDTATTVDVTTIRVPTLDIEQLAAFSEGEQQTVRFTARDAAGAEVRNAEVLLRSSDTSVIAVLPNLKVQSKRTGSAWVVGRFGNAFDSVQVIVRSLNAAAARGGTTGNTADAAIPFVRPTIDAVAIRQREHEVYRARVDSALKDSRIVRVATGKFIALDAVGGQVAYTFSDSTGSEKRTGVLYGGAMELAPFKRIRLGAEFRKGTLTPTAGGLGNELSLTQVSGDLTMHAADYLGIRLGAALRAVREGDSLALQHWVIPRASVISRLNFIGDRISTLAGISILPGASYTGADAKPEPLSYSGEAGIEFNSAWFRADLLYTIERLSFPKAGTQQRLDQFSTIRLRMGLRRGR